jgi:hypothetical protein
MRGLARLFIGAILGLAMAAPASAADPPGAVTLDIQHTKPTDIVWSTVRMAGGRTTVTGLVRHRGPPGRNGIYGHVVAAVERAAAAVDSSTETRIDVPVVAVAKPHTTAREARFSFELPRGPGAATVVHLRYIEAPMLPRQ